MNLRSSHSSLETHRHAELRRLGRTLVVVAWPATLLLAVWACTIERPAQFATASALPSGPRRPDGVAVDLLGSIPPVAPRASTNLGLVSLREPVDMSGAVTSVRQFFEAVSREDKPALGAVLTADALAFMPSNPQNSGMRLEDSWDRRFAKFDYKATGPEPVFRETAIEMYNFGDLEDAEGDRPTRPQVMDQHDVLVRVPIEIRRVGADRLYGDEMLFVVRRLESSFRIRAVVEDFQPY